MSRRRRSIDIFNLSFLDVVSCGFGAIILLLVIVKVSEPHVIEKLAVDLSGLVQRLGNLLPALIQNYYKNQLSFFQNLKDLVESHKRQEINLSFWYWLDQGMNSMHHLHNILEKQ